MFSSFPGTENWFYVDDRNVAFLQSGRYPKHRRGTDVDLPFWGDGRADWQGFNPDAYTFKAIANSRRPRALDPKAGFFISWNNKEAPGWRKGPREWDNGPVHRALILQRKLLVQKKQNGGKLDATHLARAVNLAATTDLRGEEVYPWMRRVIGKTKGVNEAALKLLDTWRQSGAHRLDSDGDNVYENSAAVALMDAWWPRAITAQFRPGLGPVLFEQVENDVLSLNDQFDWGWASHAQKDLRGVLGKRGRGRYSRVYCGGPVKRPVGKRKLRRARSKCRQLLLSTLRLAYTEVAGKQGTSDPAQWKVMATCEPADPPACDQIVPTTAGAIDTPPFPWQNRGTFHQVVALTGHR
jgi:hypothetical protein